MAYDGNTWLTYLIYSLIVFASFLGNSLVLYVLISRRSYLKHPHNIFIFSLGLTDIITSVFLVFSRFLYIPPTPASQISGEIFCRTIWSAVVIFNLNYISIYTVLALTIERWLAIVKPLVYRSMKRRHAVIALVVIWVCGTLVNATSIWRTKFIKAQQRCTWTYLNVANKELPWLSSSLQTLIPFSAIIILYSHILLVMRKLAKTNAARCLSMKRATVVALAVSVAVIVASLPSNITFTLSKVNAINDIKGRLGTVLTILRISNSAVNPILYGIYSSQFKREYKVIWENALGRIRRSPNSVHPATEVVSRTNTTSD